MKCITLVAAVTFAMLLVACGTEPAPEPAATPTAAPTRTPEQLLESLLSTTAPAPTPTSDGLATQIAIAAAETAEFRRVLLTPTPALPSRPPGPAMVQLQTITEEELIRCITFLMFAAEQHVHIDSNEPLPRFDRPSAFFSSKPRVRAISTGKCENLIDTTLWVELERDHALRNPFAP